jgi:hypothetical protein
LQSLKGDKQRTRIEAENALTHLFEPDGIPYPCVGWSASVFRMSMSRVPWTRSLGLSVIDAFLLRIKKKTLLLLTVNRRIRTVFPSRDKSNGAGHSLHYGVHPKNLRRV